MAPEPVSPHDMTTSDIVLELAALGADDEALTMSEFSRREDLATELNRRVPGPL